VSGAWKHEWKTASNIHPSSSKPYVVVDKAEADAYVAMLTKHCEQLSKRVEQLKTLLADAQGVAKAWMNLATKKETGTDKYYNAADYNAALKEAALAGKIAQQNVKEMIAQLEVEGVVLGSEPASHALPRWVPDGEVLAATKAAEGEVGQTAVFANTTHEVAQSEKPHDMIPYAKFTGSMVQVAAGKSFCQYDPEAKKLRVFLLINPHQGVGDAVVCGGIVDEQHAKIAHEALEFIAQGCVSGKYSKNQVAGKFVKWCEHACLDVVLYACSVPSAAMWNGMLVEAPEKAKSKSAIIENSLADYVKWHEKVEAAQHKHGLTTMIYDEGADSPKAGTWIHYDAFFGTLTLHAEDSDGVCFEHWATQCPNKNKAEHAAQQFKYLLDEHGKHEAVKLLKDWWYKLVV